MAKTNRLIESMKELCRKLNGEYDVILNECRIPYYRYDDKLWWEKENVIKESILKMTRIGAREKARPSLVVETGHLIGCNKEEILITPHYGGVEVCATAYGDGFSYDYVDVEKCKWDREVTLTCDVNGKTVKGSGSLEDIWEAEHITGVGNVCAKFKPEEFKKKSLKEIVDGIFECAYDTAKEAEEKLVKHIEEK